MSNEISAEMNPAQPLVYQIRIKGHLGREWTDWFEGCTITALDNGDMLLTGLVVDQAALHGVLKKVRDLGLPLLSVNRVTPDEVDASDVKQEVEEAPQTESKHTREETHESTTWG
jgi:hypothetical protein